MPVLASRRIGLVAEPIQLRSLTFKLSLTIPISVPHYVMRVKRRRRSPNLGAARDSNLYERRNPMPLIQVRVIKDVFSKEQKRQIISKLTDAMVSIEGENVRQVTWCVVEEVESGDWGIGGNALTTADVHALARGKAA